MGVLSLFNLTLCTAGHGSLLLEKASIPIKDVIDQGHLAHTRRAHDDQRFALERAWVERVEVLFSVDVDIVLLIVSYVIELTGLDRRTADRKSFSTCLISGLLVM